eukprot:3362038-Amphidinium_carterae.1
MTLYVSIPMSNAMKRKLYTKPNIKTSGLTPISKTFQSPLVTIQLVGRDNLASVWKQMAA